MTHEFLHEHPELQRDPDHVVVDRSDWEKACQPSAEVLLVTIPDCKEALYIDGELVIESQWVSAYKLIDKLVQRAVIRGGKRYAEENVLNDVGQFPRELPKVREKRYP